MGKFEFSKDDFSCNIPSWETQLSSLKGKPDLSYLELGVYEGRSLIWMMENILTHNTCRAYAIDRFENDKEKVFRRNLEVSGWEEKVTVSKGLFSQELKKLHISGKTFDVIYEDGSHVAAQTLETLVLAWPLLKDNGILIIDDYEWNEGFLPEFTNKLAVDSFLLCYRQELDLRERYHQVILQKKKALVFGEDQLNLGKWVFQIPDGILIDSESLKRVSIEENDLKVLRNSLKDLIIQNASGSSEFQRAIQEHKGIQSVLEKIQGF